MKVTIKTLVGVLFIGLVLFGTLVILMKSGLFDDKGVVEIGSEVLQGIESQEEDLFIQEIPKADYSYLRTVRIARQGQDRIEMVVNENPDTIIGPGYGRFIMIKPYLKPRVVGYSLEEVLKEIEFLEGRLVAQDIHEPEPIVQIEIEVEVDGERESLDYQFSQSEGELYLEVLGQIYQVETNQVNKLISYKAFDYIEKTIYMDYMTAFRHIEFMTGEDLYPFDLTHDDQTKVTNRQGFDVSKDFVKVFQKMLEISKVQEFVEVPAFQEILAYQLTYTYISGEEKRLSFYDWDKEYTLYQEDGYFYLVSRKHLEELREMCMGL